MVSITKAEDRTCAQCGSSLINLEWEERLDPHQVQRLWKCLECRKEFVTLDSDEENSTSTEVIEPFFTNLVVE